MLRSASMAKPVGVEIYPIELDEAAERLPLLNTSDLVGALYIPHDGMVSPVDVTMALAKGAKNGGVRMVFEGVAVEKLQTANGRMVGVDTEQGFIEAESVVLATGMWTRHLAATVGVNVPLQACEHFYIVTEPLEGVPSGMPVIRDPGGYTYFAKAPVEEILSQTRHGARRSGHQAAEDMPGASFASSSPGPRCGASTAFPAISPLARSPRTGITSARSSSGPSTACPFSGSASSSSSSTVPSSFSPDGVFYLGDHPDIDRCVLGGRNSVAVETDHGPHRVTRAPGSYGLGKGHDALS